MCFGQNDAGATECRHCTLPIRKCGWTLWFPYDKLPKEGQSVADSRHGPKILTVLKKKWSGVKVGYDDPSKPPSV